MRQQFFGEFNVAAWGADKHQGAERKEGGAMWLVIVVFLRGLESRELSTGNLRATLARRQHHEHILYPGVAHQEVRYIL